MQKEQRNEYQKKYFSDNPEMYEEHKEIMRNYMRKKRLKNVSNI